LHWRRAACAAPDETASSPPRARAARKPFGLDDHPAEFVDIVDRVLRPALSAKGFEMVATGNFTVGSAAAQLPSTDLIQVK
jgi:hypothetical protein